jgi:hypothetical protein
MYDDFGKMDEFLNRHGKKSALGFKTRKNIVNMYSKWGHFSPRKPLSPITPPLTGDAAEIQFPKIITPYL